MDPGTRRLALIAGGLGAALLAIIGGWSLMGHRSTAVPVVQADSRPIRVKPENPGGMQIAGAERGHPVGRHRAPADGKLAPPPEAPAPQALLAPPPPPSPRRLSAPRPRRLPAPAAAERPQPKPAPQPVAPSAAAAPPREAPGRAGGERRAGAARRGDVRGSRAQSEWQRLSKHMPDLFGQRQPAFSKTEHDGRTLWRVRTGGFADAAQATSILRAGARQGGRLLGGRASESRHRRHRRADAVGRRGGAVPRPIRPRGVILFARNIEDPAQLAALIAALRRVPAAAARC